MTLRDVGVEEPVEKDDAHWRKREVGLALRNAAKLGGSLTITWGIGIVVRLYLPRYLGPERFGMLSFADAFTTAAFVFLGLGLDTYVRKEVSVRPDHASEFIGGVVLLRMLLAVLVFAGMEAVLAATHRPDEVRDPVRIYGIAQLFVIGSHDLRRSPPRARHRERDVGADRRDEAHLGRRRGGRRGPRARSLGLRPRARALGGHQVERARRARAQAPEHRVPRRDRA